MLARTIGIVFALSCLLCSVLTFAQNQASASAGGAFTPAQLQSEVTRLGHDLDDPKFDYSTFSGRIRPIMQDLNSIVQDMDPEAARNLRLEISDQLRTITAGHQKQIDDANRVGRVKYLQQPLGCSDQEFAVLAPFIVNVVQASGVTATGQPGGFVMRNIRLGQLRNVSLPPLQMATYNLQMALEDPSSTSDSIAAKVEALQLARQKAAADLKIARHTLQALLTSRQEAYLTAEGLLD